MTIDIITYTDEQYATLTLEQLKEIREAQLKKDRLTIELEEEIQTQKDALVRKGIFNSALFQLIKDKLEGEYNQEIDLLRDGLVFYLKYSMQPDGSETDAPYTVNFALSYEARFNVVKEYYEKTYSDPVERFEAFKGDAFALRYLGELYTPLREYFRAAAV